MANELLETGIELPGGGKVVVIIGLFCSDDDSSSRRVLRGTNDGGKMANWIGDPQFAADPGHRKKCLVKKWWAQKIPARVINYVSKCFMAAVRQGIVGDDLPTHLRRMSAALEHVRGVHINCAEFRGK